MDSFNDQLLKLREIYERELEGWQLKVHELSNKKGCDTKRMEELFSRNQQMKEQQRMLTENIKTLENRLRAGLCDRCTVTEEFANRRQQEFEASHIQNLQRISQMGAEINTLKKENKRLREEMRTFRAALDGHASNSADVKPSPSSDFPPFSGAKAINKSCTLPPEGEVAMETERELRAEEQQRALVQSNCESYELHSLSGGVTSQSWKSDYSAAHSGERRHQGIEGLDQQTSISPQLLLKNSSSPSRINPGRHILHNPVPCRPQPIRGGPGPIPWSLTETSDWMNAAISGTNQVMQPSSKPNIPRFPNIIPTNQHVNFRRQSVGPPWPKSSPPQFTPKEPTVLFKFRNLPDYLESQIQPRGKGEIQAPKVESVSSEGIEEACDGPLDLSDRGKSKSSQTSRNISSPHGAGKVQKTSENTSSHVTISSPSPVCLSSSSSSTSPTKHPEEEPANNHDHKVIKEMEQKDEPQVKAEQSSEKRVPVLTISLRPAVVVLETLNSTLQKQEPLSSNGSSSTAAEPGSSTDERDERSSSSESGHGGKRKRVDTETEPDSDTDRKKDNVVWQ